MGMSFTCDAEGCKNKTDYLIRGWLAVLRPNKSNGVSIYFVRTMDWKVLPPIACSITCAHRISESILGEQLATQVKDVLLEPSDFDHITGQAIQGNTTIINQADLEDYKRAFEEANRQLPFQKKIKSRPPLEVKS